MDSMAKLNSEREKFLNKKLGNKTGSLSQFVIIGSPPTLKNNPKKTDHGLIKHQTPDHEHEQYSMEYGRWTLDIDRA